MENFFLEMFDYERWSNEQILNWLLAHPYHPEMVKVFAHLIAENLPWLYLLRGQYVPDDFDPEPNWSLEECRSRLSVVMEALQTFVASATQESLSKIVRSPGRNSVVFENTAGEILAHLLNHAEHHRGQIIGMIAQETGEYVPSVYMSYLRQKGAGRSTELTAVP